MGFFSEHLVGRDAPVAEQGEDCLELLYDTVCALGGDVKVTTRFPGKAFLLPGGLTEWSAPDLRLRTHIEHDRNYAALVRYVGDTAKKLVVLETESWLIRPEKALYYTERRMYRLQWDTEVVDAQALKVEIVSPKEVHAQALTRGYRDDLLLEVTEELEFDEDKNEWKDPRSFRSTEHELLTAADIDILLNRIEQFRGDAVSARGIDYQGVA
jgi:hypothetical protein